MHGGDAGAATEAAKRAAGMAAVDLVEDGMTVGLGTGSTARHFIDGLGRRVREGLRVNGVATSVASAAQAAELGIPLLDQVDGEVDLTVDGADEIDPTLNLVKGLGGALLREKVVAAASRRMVVVATADKLVPALGRGPLPVEVLPLLWRRTADAVRRLGLEAALRLTGSDPFVTDNGNYILHCHFDAGRNLDSLAAALEAIPGVMGHGLFLGLAEEAFVGYAEGEVRRIRPATASV